MSVLSRLFNRRSLPIGDAHCFECGSWIVGADDDARVCVKCGGRNRTAKAPKGHPPWRVNVNPTLRGRVSRSSNLANGITSAVVHFGIDEPAAKGLAQDVLVEVRIVGKGKP